MGFASHRRNLSACSEVKWSTVMGLTTSIDCSPRLFDVVTRTSFRHYRLVE